MRGNSGFLRWMPSVARSSVYFGRYTALMVVTLALLAQLSHAGPVNTRHRRMMREVYTDYESKNQTDVQPEAGTCFLDGLQVPESSVHCDKKPGCREIQKTGYCCPDYQCDCERDGKTYSNGEKLVDPKTPCTVCYCQGGEITCSNVSCYKRSDCEPKYIAGRCCPEYDNCPPLEHVTPTTNKETQSMSGSSQERVSLPFSSTPKTDVNNNNPLGIKIKEITKAEEIRIIDEKPKPGYPIMKPMDSLNSNQMKISTSKENQPGSPIESSNPPEDELLASFSPNSSETKGASGGVSAETVNKLEMADVNAVNDEDSQKTVRHTRPAGSSNGETPESPEEVSGEDKKAAATQIGKEVVIVDRNGNSKPITVFGVEGLQRGDVAADAPYENNTSSEKEDDRKEIHDLDLAASSSDDIRVLPLNPVSDKYSTERTTEGLAVGSSVVFDTVLYTLGPDVSEESLNLTGIVFDTVLYDKAEGTGPLNVTTDGPKPLNSHHQHVDDYDSTSNEPNPAYPTIEDDLSNYGREDNIPPLVEDYLEGSHKGKSSEPVDEPQAPEEIKVSTEGLGSSSPIMSTNTFKSESTTEGLLIRSLSDVDLISAESRIAAPGEPLLIPEWERNTTTESPMNETESIDVILKEEVLEPGSGSGFGQMSLEPTRTALKGVSVIDESEESIGGLTAHNSMSSEIMGDDPNMDTDSITYHEGVGTAEGISPFQPLEKAIEAMHNFQKGYLTIF